VKRIGLIDHQPGKRHHPARSVRHPIQEPPSPHIGKQTDVNFGHREPETLGHDPVAGTGHEAHTSSHADALHPGDHGLGVGMDHRIELVFHLEKSVAVDETSRTARANLSDDFGHVASRAEALFACTFEHHGDYSLVARPIA
jgi:hypothetical protein